MHKVFVSYSSREADRANEIVEQLEKAGIPCWIAPRDIAVGSNYTKDIPKAIRECTHFLLALSANAEASKWVNKELTRAINQEKCLIPLMIENFTISEGFEFLLEDVQIRNYCTDCQGVLQEVIGLFPNATPAPTPVPDKKTAEEYYQMGGKAYNSGQYEEAVGWYQKAADLGHKDAMCDLGYCYEFEKGVTKDLASAAKWYMKSANLGNAVAQCNLAYCYYAGNGVTKNLVEAVKWYKKAAEQGHIRAQYNLALCYQNGDGVAKDPLEAVKWYKKAVEQGDSDAQLNLGYCYEMGNGVKKDIHKAVELFRSSAEQGNAIAQYNLGICYKNGRGVAVDLAEAKKWFQKAADQGYENAKKQLATLQ